MKKLIFALICLLLTVPCRAEIYIVDHNWPYDFDNIQDAINSSDDGDYIFVFPGTYSGSINFLGRAVTVRSFSPTDPCFVAQTVIECSVQDYAVNFVNGENANAVLTGFTITNCVEGAVYCLNSSPTISNCVITGNTITMAGGVISCESGSPLIINCSITGNQTVYGIGGGGISCIYGSNPTITDCIISGNTKNGSGAGISCYFSSPLINNCVITGNQSLQGDGGGISCYDSSNPVISDCTISNNIASDGRWGGGGIFCGDYSSPIITGCTISGNSVESYYYGGGICVVGSLGSPTITGCIITGNHSGEGGGIYCEDYYQEEGSLTITGCIISQNTASGEGGGIYVRSSLTLTNCIMTGNSAGEDGGGIGCYYGGEGFTVAGCTISGNKAERNGGGIYIENTSIPVSVTNSIIWGSSDSSGSGQSAQLYGGRTNVWFSCIQDNNPGDTDVPFGEDRGNIDDDPCFVGPGFWDVNGWHDGDYHLSLTSPCVEAGDPYYIYNIGDIDIDAQPRLMGRYIDMGADEAQITVIVVTKPQAGDVWAAGSTHQVNWNSFGITGAVDISYSANNGADWIHIDNVPDTGSFIWYLPWEVDSNLCLVTIEPNVPIPNFNCVDSGVFTILPYNRGQQVSSVWKSLGGDFDRSGLSQSSGPQLGCIKWQFHTNGSVSASPAIGAYGRVHLACEDGVLYTLDADGQLLWSYDTGSPLLSSPSIGDDGSLYVGAENGKLYAFGIDGNLQWTHTTGGPVYSSPAISEEGIVYTCSRDGTLYALDRDGSELWTFETAGVSPAATGAIFASPAIGPNGDIYIAGLYDPNLYALDQYDGHVKWSCSFLDPCDPLSPKPRPFASPVVAPNGAIYQTLLYNPRQISDSFWYDSKLYAIDPNQGNIIWATNMTETPTQNEEENPQPPEPDYWFRKYYYDSYTQWSNGFPPYPFTATDFGVDVVRYYRVSNSSSSESALGPDGTIYVSFDDQYLRAVDPNGSIKWVTSLGWVGGFTLTVGSNGLIYAASDDGRLCVVDPDGKEIARFENDNWLSFPVITSDNSIIVCDANNTVWAIGNGSCQGKAAALHRLGDLNADWTIDFIDFAVLADGWLDCTDTSFNPVAGGAYCGDPENEIFVKSDVDRDQYVDFTDLAELANRWLIQE